MTNLELNKELAERVCKCLRVFPAYNKAVICEFAEGCARGCPCDEHADEAFIFPYSGSTLVSTPPNNQEDTEASSSYTLLSQGDYVLATRWSGGDPKDPWYVGTFAKVVDGRIYLRETLQPFRRAEKIPQDVGEYLLRHKDLISSGTLSMWKIIRYIQKHKTLIFGEEK